MSLLSHALVSLDDVKGEACLNISGTGHDAALTELINYVTELFENAMNGRRIASTTFSSLGADEAEEIDPLDGPGTKTLWLPQYPVTSVAELKLDGEAVDARPDVNSSGYVVDKDSGRLRYVGGIFTAGEQNVDITYTAGYSTVPADIKQVALYEIKMAWTKIDKNTLGQASEADAQGNRTWVITDLLPETKRVLNGYRRVNA